MNQAEAARGRRKSRDAIRYTVVLPPCLSQLAHVVKKLARSDRPYKGSELSLTEVRPQPDSAHTISIETPCSH
jgi:hypothetical protein